MRGLRRHWIFGLLMLAGLALRVLTQVAYWPALIATDSAEYLNDAMGPHVGTARPSGFPIVMSLLPYRGHLWTVPLAQHLLALVVAVVIYLLVLRLGGRPWVAALAAAPVLLDYMQLDLEHFIMPDAIFSFEVLLACACLVVVRRPGVRAATLLSSFAGLLFGLAAITRTGGEAAIVPAVLCVAMAWSRINIRVALAGTAALILGFGAIYGTYTYMFTTQYDGADLSVWSGRFLYARVATFATCKGVQLPSYERSLCVWTPPQDRPSGDYYQWDLTGPEFHVSVPHGKTLEAVLTDFSMRVIKAHPRDYADSIAKHLVQGFAVERFNPRQGLAVSNWQFIQTPHHVRSIKLSYARFAGGQVQVNHDVVTVMADYQRFGFVPGPLLAIGVLAPLALLLGHRWRRRDGLLMPSLLFSGVAVAVLLAVAAGSEFDWRLQLPQLTLLPPAAALALTALFDSRRLADATPSVAEPEAPALDVPANSPS